MSYKKNNEYCGLFLELFIAPSVCIFYLKSCCTFPKRFLGKQIKFELISPKIVYALENKELLSHFRVYRKSATSA